MGAFSKLGTTTRRRAGLVGGAAVLAIIGLASAAFGCAPVVGAIAITALDDAGNQAKVSVGVGEGPSSAQWSFEPMNMCADADYPQIGVADGVKGGAQADQGENIVIAVAPTVCASAAQGHVDEGVAAAMAIAASPAGCAGNVVACADALEHGVLTYGPDLALNGGTNSLLTDPQAEISFQFDTFDTSPVYSYTLDYSRACMQGTDPNSVGTAPVAYSMAVEGGVGAAIVPVPAGLASSGGGTAAGVCVNSRPLLPEPAPPTGNRGWRVSQAPLFVI